LIEPLSILFEDEHCLALSKPAGQFSQGSWAPEGETTLETAVRHYLQPAAPDRVYLGIVHRLDRPTSGVIIWAKTEKAARRLSTQFLRRTAVKEYWGIVEPAAIGPSPGEALQPTSAGTALDGEQVWHDWLSRPDDSGRASAVGTDAPGAREAITRVRQGQAVSLPLGCTWLRLRPETGRTHQLRIQAARRGTPILGDVIYGANRPLAQPHRVALHARSLTVRHPTIGRDLVLVAEVPSWWNDEGIVLGQAELARSGLD
jgi:23S rRNA pseudouridine1911/1915/1917 synthase